MEFYDVAGHVLERLQRQKRVSYRALKRQFSLDDDYIEDLKDELIYAKKLAVDEDSRVLVWIGDTDAIEPTSVLESWALATRGQGEEAIAQIRQGLVTTQTSGAELMRPYSLGLQSGVYRHIGQPSEGLTALDEALSLITHTGERWYEAELHRLKGQLLLQQSADNTPEAESCFHQALSVARHQEAKSLELRASTSLARLWQQQDKRQEAYDILASVYSWFTEGFDTADLIDAKALLDELSEDSS